MLCLINPLIYDIAPLIRDLIARAGGLATLVCSQTTLGCTRVAIGHLQHIPHLRHSLMALRDPQITLLGLRGIWVQQIGSLPIC